MAVSDAPRREDLDKCVHCGLCLNACPTYRELGVEMDSPRGRIYQMVQVANGAPVTAAYREHIDLCLACRGCETACPSGVKYGRLIEAARADIEQRTSRPLSARIARTLIFDYVLPEPRPIAFGRRGTVDVSTLRHATPGARVRDAEGQAGRCGVAGADGRNSIVFCHLGRVFPAQGQRKHRVALLSGCIANICFARLNEATVRVLQANGCEVTVHGGQTCCGALHVHAGLRDQARKLARKNVDALAGAGYDAILTNAGGCGSTLKEYDELLEHDPAYAERARLFVGLMKDVNEFLAAIGLNPRMGEVREVITYQDSCHLAHGQRVRSAPRELLGQVPGLTLKEMPMSDLCCGSAGIYNVVHTEMALALLKKKMASVNSTGASRIVTANPGCILQLRAGVERHGRGQRVSHVVEVLDEAYRAV